MALDVSSRWPPTMNAHQLHNSATAIVLMWPPAVVVVSYAFVSAAAELSMQNHFLIYPE